MASDLHARIEAGWQRLSRIEQMGDETILVASCVDYESFQALPPVLRYEERRYLLTGWNSDSGEAYWKHDPRMIALIP